MLNQEILINPELSHPCNTKTWNTQFKIWNIQLSQKEVGKYPIASNPYLQLCQARQNVRPNLDPICLTFWWYSWNNFMKLMSLKKISRRQKSVQRRQLKIVPCNEISCVSLSITSSSLSPVSNGSKKNLSVVICLKYREYNMWFTNCFFII